MLPIAIRLRGKFNPEILQRCLVQLQLRHEVLRTRIKLLQGMPFQLVSPREASHIPIRPVATQAENNIQDVLKENISDFINQKDEYPSDTVFDGMILRFGDSDHVLVLAIDHIVTDGYSNRILLDELRSLCLSEISGYEVKIPRLGVQFPDYVSSLLDSHATWKACYQSYWNERFSSAEHIASKTDRSARTDSVNFSSLSIPISASLAEKIMRPSGGYRYVPALLVLGAYAAAVMHLCDRRDLAVTFVDSCRNRPELTSMVGCLAGHLHFLVEIRGNPTLRDFVESVSREYSAAYAHGNLDWMRESSLDSASDLIFNFASGRGKSIYDRRDTSSAALDQLRIDPVPIPYSERFIRERAGIFPWKLGLWGGGSATQLELSLFYQERMFASSSGAELQRNFVILLRAAVEECDIHVETIFRRLGRE